MTRKEIREWKERIEDSLNRMETCIDFYRATLEEAARAVCGDCRRGDPAILPSASTTREHHHPTGFAGYCTASPIHDLIAGLDKEGDRE